MKRKNFLIFLGCEAAVCTAVSIALQSQLLDAGALLSFPFKQIGMGLRALSLSGGVGNGAALAIYFILCLAPAALLLLIRRKRRLMGEDALPALLSVLLFPVLYLMINPAK